MSFTSLKDFKELKTVLSLCGNDTIIGCEKCPYAEGEQDCLDRCDEGKQAAIDLVIKYLEKQEKRKRKHG